MQRVVAALLLFRHEGKFGVAFDDGGVEGGELVAFLILACADQQFVGQVGTATQGTDGLSNSIFVFKPKVVNLQKTRERVGDLAVSPVIEAGQYLVSLDKHEIGDEECGCFASEQIHGGPILCLVITCEVSDKNICVESDHRGDFRNPFAAPDWTAA